MCVYYGFPPYFILLFTKMFFFFIVKEKNYKFKLFYKYIHKLYTSKQPSPGQENDSLES